VNGKVILLVAIVAALAGIGIWVCRCATERRC